MDIHKPAPVHSLREFASEILIIVTGVLIALGLEQAVEAWHWHDRVDHATAALADEIAETVGQGKERLLVADCVDRRLDELASLVDAGAVAGRLPPIGSIGVPPVRTYSTGVWQSALAGQTAEHFSDERRNIYGVIHGFSAQMASANADELQAWTRLYTVVGPGRPLSDADAEILRAAISEARTDNQILLHNLVRVVQAARHFRVPVNHDLAATYADSRWSYSVCHPIGPPPPHYGNSPITDAVGVAQRSARRPGHTGAPLAGRVVS